MAKQWKAGTANLGFGLVIFYFDLDSIITFTITTAGMCKIFVIRCGNSPRGDRSKRLYI